MRRPFGLFPPVPAMLGGVNGRGKPRDCPTCCSIHGQKGNIHPAKSNGSRIWHPSPFCCAEHRSRLWIRPAGGGRDPVGGTPGAGVGRSARHQQCRLSRPCARLRKKLRSREPGATGMPPVFRGPGMARRKTPVKDEERREPEGRNSRAAFLLVTFLWPHKEKSHAAFRQDQNKTFILARLRNHAQSNLLTISPHNCWASFSPTYSPNY
jgi:hypothetical protein